MSDAAYFLLELDTRVTLVLDDTRLKNVIIMNSKVKYLGGPAQLENVYFVNCTFEIVRQPTGQLFASAVLSKAATTFSAS